MGKVSRLSGGLLLVWVSGELCVEAAVFSEDMVFM